MAKKSQFSFCTVIRRKEITHRTMSLSGSYSGIKETGKEWRTEACGTPLFGDQDTKTGICRSCASKWQVPQNFIIAHYYEWGNEPAGHVSTGAYVDGIWRDAGYMLKADAVKAGLTFNNPHA